MFRGAPKNTQRCREVHCFMMVRIIQTDLHTVHIAAKFRFPSPITTAWYNIHSLIGNKYCSDSGGKSNNDVQCLHGLVGNTVSLLPSQSNQPWPSGLGVYCRLKNANSYQSGQTVPCWITPFFQTLRRSENKGLVLACLSSIPLPIRADRYRARCLLLIGHRVG
jgi:hypothetical protein